ncbi:prepilin peptidase [Pelosinus sp. IPA-1]|uniref:prepilin peptidase n=1 Tax=Pelosinus sp. IPA-1 TaxID=3029569 RepID=UPI0024362380|nr:prepilin peptidase [Pelosinus sp. IPA-1]GMA99447.1 type 4 prepilin-like proteins leader peptide-processing enzyme [Pelosinus sp. IPA-1]
MLTLIIIMVGLIIGSFVNVCIYRLPQNQSIITPSSHCMTCNTHLKPWDLIPFLSYLLSRGRCRYCGVTFSSRYFVLEILTAILFVWCLYIFGVSLELLKALILTSFLLVITFIDYDHQLILDKVLLWLFGAGVVINLWTNSLEIWDMISASLLGGGILLLIALVSRGGMGGGDIKFATALGIWLGWEYLLLTLLLSFIFGGVGGLLLLAFKLKTRKDFIPFGPFIALGALVSTLYGNQIITWYLERL